MVVFSNNNQVHQRLKYTFFEIKTSVLSITKLYYFQILAHLYYIYAEWQAAESQRLPNVRLTRGGSLLFFTVPLDGAARFCCCYGLWTWKMLLRRCYAMLLQLLSQFQFSRQLSSTVLCHQGSFKKATSYGELLSEFYLFDAKSYFAKVEKN